MPVAHATLETPLAPAEVLKIITDFGPERAKAWPGVDLAHLTVHDQGEGWADVTEGNDTTWERVRYAWSPTPETISAEKIESNVWAQGSRWDYRLTPAGTGTRVDVTLTRRGANLKGRLIGALLPLVGRSVITKSLQAALRAGGAAR